MRPPVDGSAVPKDIIETAAEAGAAEAGAWPAASARPTAAFRTLGCKLNQCETAQMQESLLAAGYQLVSWKDHADLRIVNTCTVTAKSDSDCRREIRLAKRVDPHCTVVVTGCYAQVDPQAVARIPGVDLVLGNPDKARLVEALRGLQTETPVVAVSAYEERAEFDSESFTRFHGYTRAFLKIQNGCDARCAYCIIPLARGPARSMPAQQVLEQVRLLGQRGFREVVLTGINLGCWGRDTGEGSLADLLERLLGTLAREDEAAGTLGRLRLSSIEPLEVHHALIEVIARAGAQVAHHFHLPLQSGSDSVLRRMGRPYTTAQYQEVVEALADRFPEAALGADLIAGFPGETEEEFAETLAFLERLPLTYFHVFTYSDRPGTPASQMQPKIPPETARERGSLLRRLGHQKTEKFRARLKGTTQRALILNERDQDGRLLGITGNYMEALVPRCPADETLINRFVQVELKETRPDGRWEVELR